MKKALYLGVAGWLLSPLLVLAQTPGSVTIRVVSSTQICVTWTNTSPRLSGSEIWRSTDNRTFNKVADVTATTTDYCNTGLTPSTRYYYYVKGLVVSTNGFNSATVNAITFSTPPVVNDLRATTQGATSIQLTWTDVGKEANYTVERRTGQSGDFIRIANTNAGYLDKNLTPNTEYCYRVQFDSSVEPAGYSSVACATTQAPTVTILRLPSNLSALAVSFSQINLTWTDNADNESGFDLERSTTGNDPWNKIADLPANTTSYSDQTLQPRTRYFYRVRAKNSAGGSPNSNMADATTPDSPPAAPARLTAAATSPSQINLEWADVSDNETGFQLERSTDGTSWSKIADLLANTTTYQNTGLNPSTRYVYRIRALNAVGASDYSNTADATTKDKPLVPPATPVRLVATLASATQINLAWADGSDNESGFEIERGSTATGTFTKIADIPANSTTYEDKGLIDNKPYCYRVRAKNAAGVSGYTDPACATTPLAPPAAPSNLTAQVQDYDQIRLTWPELSAKALTVIIERSISPTTGFVEIKQQPAAQTGYLDIGLQEFTTYYYRIRAVNTAGNSGYSNIASARVNEVVIAVEDELETHTTLYTTERTLHILTNWYSTTRATLLLVTATGQPVLTDNRKVNEADRWHYDLGTLPTGVYIIHIAVNGRALTKRILLP